MIYITGDTHADFTRFSVEAFPEQKEMDRNDYVIICGDFGGVWDYTGESKHEKYWLDWLEDKPYTTLFVDGNHENFNRLYEYQEKEWHGGMIHEIRPHVLHLMRGYVFDDIDGVSVFSFGGALSHDIDDGVLDPNDENFEEDYKRLSREHAMFRVVGRSWWPEEMPSIGEMTRGFRTLSEHKNSVDFIITHNAPSSDLALLYHGNSKISELNSFLEMVRITAEYKRWFFGHHHINKAINDKDIALYEQIVRIH